MGEKLDVIIFGATGFTGLFVIKDAVDILHGFKWGVAGRNKGRLENALKEVGSKLNKDLSNTPVVVADVKEQKSIEEMAKRCKVVINCCGPYQHYGEVVVKACVEAGTHHIDISGEPQFIDKMQLKYNALAQEKGSYVVSTCGFESIPADLGVVYTEKQFPGTVNSVEMFLENKVTFKDPSNKALLHYGTWESAVYAMKNGKEILALQKQLEKESKIPKLHPKLNLYPLIQKPTFLDSYFIPFPATDRETVQRSQRLFYELNQQRPIQFQSYLGFKSLSNAIIAQLMAFVIMIFSLFTFTRKLLLRYPQVFTLGVISHKGPAEVNANEHFFIMTFKAKGWAKNQALTEKPTQELTTRVTGFSPFYGMTSVGMVCAAKIMLKESQKMPRTGGVMPPGAAFANTSFIEELTKPKYGLKFETVN